MKIKLKQIEEPSTFPVTLVHHDIFGVRVTVEMATKITESSVWIWNGIKVRRLARVSVNDSYFDGRTLEGRKAAYEEGKRQLDRWQRLLDKHQKEATALEKQLGAFRKRGFKFKQ